MAEGLDSDTPVRRKPDVLHSRMDATVFALDVHSGNCFSFEGPSGRLWELLDQPISAAEAARLLTREYEVDEARCRDEVTAYFQRLSDEGLIVAER